MKSKKHRHHGKQYYIGVDIGGTKIQAVLARESGVILCREKVTTPRDGGSEAVVAAVMQAIQETANKADVAISRVAAIGAAVPGVVDPDRGYVAIAPNMHLSGVSLGPHLENHFKIPVVMGNDANFGALGEAWLGSARRYKSMLYICVGTGVGSGLVLNKKMWRGDRESAGEIGHMIIEIDGPTCGCGNRGCLETLASRTAIERNLRKAIESGRSSALTELTNGDLSVIRSGVLRKAIEMQDPLAMEVVGQAARILGYACLNVRHLVDPEAIVLGGGVMQACGHYMLPLIEQVVAQDTLTGAREGGKILLSALGDDAVCLGAVAAARKIVGRNPFKKRFRSATRYPRISRYIPGKVVVGNKVLQHDFYVSVNGKIKARKTKWMEEDGRPDRAPGLVEIEKICQGGPEIMYFGVQNPDVSPLNEETKAFLDRRSIRAEILPVAKVFDAYNKSKQRKALWVEVGKTAEEEPR